MGGEETDILGVGFYNGNNEKTLQETVPAYPVEDKYSDKCGDHGEYKPLKRTSQQKKDIGAPERSGHKEGDARHNQKEHRLFHLVSKNQKKKQDAGDDKQKVIYNIRNGHGIGSPLE